MISALSAKVGINTTFANAVFCLKRNEAMPLIKLALTCSVLQVAVTPRSNWVEVLKMVYSISSAPSFTLIRVIPLLKSSTASVVSGSMGFAHSSASLSFTFTALWSSKMRKSKAMTLLFWSIRPFIQFPVPSSACMATNGSFTYPGSSDKTTPFSSSSPHDVNINTRNVLNRKCSFFIQYYLNKK